MLKRSICIFPKFDNVDAIQQLRKQYDPLYESIQPHITLVFPFGSNLVKGELEAHVAEVLDRLKPFRLKLQRITGSEGGYLFLNVKQGNDEIIKMHDRLYTGILKKYLFRKVSYLPQITVGRLENPHDFGKALAETKSMSNVYETEVTEVVSEMIAESGNSTIEFRLGL